MRFYAVVAAYVIPVGGALAATRMKANADGSWLGDLAWAVSSQVSEDRRRTVTSSPP